MAPLPTILVGGGNGRAGAAVSTIELREPTPIANLHLTIWTRSNARQDSFGDSTGLIGGV